MASEPFAPGAAVLMSTTDDGEPVAATVAHDDGGDTVVINIAHPHLEDKTILVPVMRIFLSPAG